MLSRITIVHDKGERMNIVRLIPLITASALAIAAGAAAAEPLCFTARLGSGLGAARIDLKVIVDSQAPFAEIAGEARFSQPVSPPGSLIVYAVSGVAIPNADGFWVSLAGTGYDLATTIYRGTIAAQLSLNPAKHMLSYTRQNLDGSSSGTSTGVPEFVLCPQ